MTNKVIEDYQGAQSVSWEEAKVSKKDVKEWFVNLEQEDRTRINTIALFNGRFVKNDDDPTDYGDYEDVRLFSKLNIPVEFLSLSKDLNIIYRIYGA